MEIYFEKVVLIDGLIVTEGLVTKIKYVILTNIMYLFYAQLQDAK